MSYCFETFKHNYDVCKDLRNELRKETLNMNFYIDSNHLFLHLTEHASVMASLNKRFLSEAHKQDTPDLPIDRHVYLHLLKIFKKEIQNIIYEKIKYGFHKKGIDIINDHDLISVAIENKSKMTRDITTLFNSDYAQKKEWDKNRLLFIQQDLYVNFFYGELDEKYLINTLKKRCREEKNIIKKKEFKEIYKSFEKKIDSDNEKVINNHRYNEFKTAIQLFSDSENNALTEVWLGKVRFDIHDKKNVFVSFSEKAVDTNLTLKAYDDFLSSTENDQFIFITNDSDFAPLISRINQKKNLILAPAVYKYRVSNDLKKIVSKNLIINLYDVFKTHQLKWCAREFYETQDVMSENDILKNIDDTNICSGDFSIEYWDKYYLDYEEEFNGIYLQPREEFAYELSMEMQIAIELLK